MFRPDEIEAFEAYSQLSTSKKDENVRRQELMKIIMKPLESFFEEHLQYYLQEINKNLILKYLLRAIIECTNLIKNYNYKLGGCGEEHSDMIDEMLR